jgi:hypothetical protein
VDFCGYALAIKSAGNPMKRAAHEVQSGDEPEACYANYFHVGHNAFEVVLEFGQHYEGVNRPRMHTRIIAAPAYAKALLDLLASAIGDYEKLYGEIAAVTKHE